MTTGDKKAKTPFFKKHKSLFIQLIMWVFALLFLFPALLTLMNAFKTDGQIILDPLSLPFLPVETNYLYQVPGDLPFAISNADFAKNLAAHVTNKDSLALLAAGYAPDKVQGVYVLTTNLSSNDTETLKQLVGASYYTVKYISPFINFELAWKATNFPIVLLNTFIITVLSTVGIILISSMAAYALVRTKTKLSWFFFLLFSLSMIVPFQTFMVPLVMLAKDLSLKSVLGIVPIYMGLGCPMAIFMYHGFIKGIPLELEEAAAVDGASIFRTFFTIIFPLLTPITATVAIINVLWIWNDFLLPLIILPKETTLQLAQFGFFGQFSKQYGRAMASLVLSASPVVIFYLVMQKYIIKGITAGAVKG